MSVYFSKYCLNGYRDDVVRADPDMRERLLQAIKELSLLGPDHPIDLSTQVTLEKSVRDNTGLGSVSDPKQFRHSDCQSIRYSLPTSRSTSNQTPHGILKDKLKRTLTPKLEKGNVKVYASVLDQDVGYKTLSITYHTTCRELVSSILSHYNAHVKDPNLYYVAMETGIKNKDSGLPISKMIVLDDDARPLELQACQPQGESKFHLKMKSGGLVRVRTNVLSPESTYKAVFISRCTTVRQLINLVISGSKTEEAPDNFRLREASADFEVDRILQEDEYPLEVQSQWKPDEGRSLFLTRVNKKVDTKSDQNLPVSTSEELKNEIAKQNQTIDTLNDVITRLQQERDLKESLLSSPNTLSSEYSDLDKGDYDQIDDIDEMPQFHCYRSPVRETEETFDSVEKLRQRRTSLDALDLKYASNDKEMAVRSKCLTSQIDKLRYSFYQFKRKGISDIDIRKDIDTGKPKESRYSQIERFRHKFLQYYKMKTVPGKVPLRRVQSTIVLPSMPVTTRSWSSSDADCITHLRELEKIFSRKASDDSLCDQEIRELFENSAARKQEDLKQAGQRTLYDVINDMGLFTVTLNRNPDEGLGLELAQVTQKGSPIEKDPTDVLYVYHKRDGETAILDSPTRDFIEEVETSSPCEDDVFSQSLESHDENHTCFGSQSKNSSAETTPIKHHNSIDENSSHLNEETESGSMSCCTLAEWRVGLGPKPRHGVRIVGMTKGGIAEKCGILEKDDVIVEVNGTNVLNSTLKVVIETLREQRTVHLVVAREKARHKVQEDNVGEPSSLGSSPVPSHHEEMLALTEQVKQLVTKVTELQESMTKKDKTIAHLKKSIMKKKLKISSKDKIVEAVQVLV